MAHNPYKELTTIQLAEVYYTTKKNYEKIDGDLLIAIQGRGGEENFLKQIDREKELYTEKARIRNEVADLMSDHQDTSLIKKLITSDLMTEVELSEYIDQVHSYFITENNNRKIDANTVVGSVTGILIASIIGALITGGQILSIGKFYIVSLVFIYGISFFTIKLITKKNAANAIIFLSAILATIVGPVTAFLLLHVSLY